MIQKDYFFYRYDATKETAPDWAQKLNGLFSRGYKFEAEIKYGIILSILREVNIR